MKRKKLALGGKGPKPKMNIINGKGSPHVEEAEDDTASFRKGGGVEKKKRDHEKLKEGGEVHGKEAKMRADKPMRHKRKDGGRTPYSAGHAMEKPTDSTAGDGHEGVRPSGE